MSKFMLDTNICIYLIKNQSITLSEKIKQCRKGELMMSSITWAELCCGIRHDGLFILNKLRSIILVADFDANAGSVYGQLTIDYPNRKANLDRMIAAHALSLNVTLVTNNLSDFEIYKSSALKIENWV